MTPLEEALLLYVHARKQSQRLAEMRIIAYAGRTAENAELLAKALGDYANLLIPGTGVNKAVEDKSKTAKDLLEREAKKLLILKPLTGATAEAAYAKAAESGNTALQSLASTVEYRKEREEYKTHLRQSRGRK